VDDQQEQDTEPTQDEPQHFELIGESCDLSAQEELHDQ
jgi:hypothetical protein